MAHHFVMLNKPHVSYTGDEEAREDAFLESLQGATVPFVIAQGLGELKGIVVSQFYHGNEMAKHSVAREHAGHPSVSSCPFLCIKRWMACRTRHMGLLLLEARRWND